MKSALWTGLVVLFWAASGGAEHVQTYESYYSFYVGILDAPNEMVVLRPDTRPDGRVLWVAVKSGLEATISVEARHLEHSWEPVPLMLFRQRTPLERQGNPALQVVSTQRVVEHIEASSPGPTCGVVIREGYQEYRLLVRNYVGGATEASIKHLHLKDARCP